MIKLALIKSVTVHTNWLTQFKKEFGKHFLRKIKMFTTFDPIIILIKIYPKKMVHNMKKAKQASMIAFY